MNMAIGMVAHTVNVPHGLAASALTTTSASTASMMIMIISTPNSAIRPGHRAQLGLDHVAERAAVAARGDEQDHEVLHRAGEDDAGQDPQRAGQIAHLRGQHRADQRAGAGDGREVVAEQDVLVGRHVIEAVVVLDGRRDAVRVEPQHRRGDEQAVEAVGDQVDADGGDDQPDGVDGFAAVQGDGAERERADDGDRQPAQRGYCFVQDGFLLPCAAAKSAALTQPPASRAMQLG